MVFLLSMPPRYFLRCLGSPELRGPTGEPIRIRTRKHLALLAFLAVEPRQPHRRDRLADLLWSETPRSEARHSLATALSVLRGKLGPRCYESTRDTVKLLVPDLEVDLDRLLRGEVLGDQFTPALEMGGFLDEFDIATAPEFMLWRDQTRAQLFPPIRAGFVTLMDRCRRTGAFARIEPLADRLLDLDGLSEEAIRAKMEARAFAGDRLSSLRIFQAWRERLLSELGATPSPLVEGMALRLRQRGYEPPGTSHIPTVQTDQWRDRAFIGRADQYRAVYERWEQTLAGKGRHAIVLGDSGIGKTTLVERLVTAAGLEGAVSARVQCYEVEREIPYAAIGTLVRGMIERPGASATPPEWLAELARTVSAVAQRFPHLPPPRDTEGETARLRLTEGVHQLATAVADEHPLILVVDDVHLADDASVAVLHLLMRRTQEQRVMIVLTARQAELAQSPNAGRLLEVRRPLALEPVEIPALNDGEMTQLVSALAAISDVVLPPAIRRSLLRASAGIPMFAELLFDDWKINRDECIALAVGAMTADAYVQSEGGLLDRIFERVFRELSEMGKAVVGLAAILGERLNDLPMYQLVDLTMVQTLSGVAELTRLRILRDGGRGLEFRNELLRGRAYYSVPSPLRKALHGLIADRLLASKGAGEPVPGLMLAWHCYRAGREHQAHPHLLRGSREAIDKGAPFEAELALQSALPKLSALTRQEARLLHVEALQEQSRWLESADQIRIEGDWDQSNLARRDSLLLCAQAGTNYSAEICTSLLEMSATQLSGDQDNRSRLQTAAAASRLTYYLSDQPQGRKILELLLTIKGESNDLQYRAGIGYSIAILAWSTKQLHRFPKLRGELEGLCSELRHGGIVNSTSFALENARGCLESAVGSYEKALEALQLAYSTALVIGDDERASYSAGNVAMCHGRLGTYPEQKAWSEVSLQTAARQAVQWRTYRAHYSLAWSLAMLGECTQAIRTIEPEVSVSAGAPPWQTQSRGLLIADIYQACGEPRKALNRALAALRETSFEMLSGANPGGIARWIAFAIEADQAPSGADQALEDLVTNIDSLDLIDQAEVLCAKIWLSEKLGIRCDSSLRERFFRQLQRLPSATQPQLHRLGMSVS